MRVSALTAAALAFSGLAVTTPVALDSRQTTGLNSAMVARGRKYIGTALTIRNDNAEQSIIKDKNEFGCITPENAMKWDATEPSQGQFSLSGADQIIQFATQNSKLVRCHTLVWYSQLPSWVSNINSNATLIQVMTNHIKTLMTRYKGKCTHWDVANEALNEDGTYRDNVFLRVIGESYLPIAFRIASEADPDAKLYYNDYNLEYGPDSAKTQGAVRIAKLIQSWGVKIDGVGLQGHLVTEKTGTQDTPTPSQEVLEGSLRAFTDLGLDVAYTEVDIRMNTPATAQKLQVQADAYARVAASCLAVPRCVGMTIWGVSDKYSWVPQTFSGEGAALLWDDNMQKKPAYAAFLKAIQDTPVNNGTDSTTANT